MMDVSETREALTGPVASVHTPFQRDGEIDYKGLGNLIDHCINAGSKTLILTYGDSLYSVLSDQDVADLTKFVSEYAAKRAMVIAADRQWWIGKEVEFAQYAKSVGADLLMVLPPNWAASCTVETFVEHYAAVAEHIPVMVVTNVFARSPDQGLETLKVLRDTVEGVVAIKDDICGAFARRMGLLVHDHWAVISGGQKQNHLDLLPYGCDGYFSTFIHFRPDIPQQYWQAIQAQDFSKVKEIIRNYDLPYFDFVGALTGGGDAGIHGTLELFGIAERWRRKPYHTLTDAEMERLKGFFQSKGLL
ncbi:MAG: dihydrodipicolinate synthase family protein [Candidatus Poribacteria bacterium]|nr:dihydrodipicolinate synthase family protein [Candidatus Poribacteria bacterium]